MRKSLVIAILTLAAALLGGDAAMAYSASQAEALSDPSHADPYTFPKVKPCCGARPDPCANGRCRPPEPRPCWRRPSGCGRADDRPVYRAPVRRQRERDYGGHDMTLTVRCDGSSEFGSIQEAVDYAESRTRGGTATIYVYGGFPGPACRGPVRITENVRITGDVDGSRLTRARLETGYGACVTVDGARTVAHLSNIDILSEGGPACVDIRGGRVHLANVMINAQRSAAAIAVTEATLSASGVWAQSGGPAISARSSLIDVSGSSFGTLGSIAYAPSGTSSGGGFLPARPYNFSPLRFFADDLDGAYGGGRAPETNSWPGTGYPPAAPPVRPVNPYPGYPAPAPSYSPPPQPAFGVPQPGGMQPGPAPQISGTPVIALEGSAATLQNVQLQGGSIGVAAVISSVYPNLDVVLRGVKITGNRGATGVLAMASGGWGQASRLIVDQATAISGYDTGIELRGATGYISGVAVTEVNRGLVVDTLAAGSAEGNRISYSSECRCIGGDCGRSDAGGRFVFRGNACNYD